MADPRETARAQESSLQTLARRIPGFGGYLDREQRRDADRLQREFLARRLGALKSSLQQVAEGDLEAGRLGQVERYDRLGNRLDRLVERVRHASSGYAGFFALVKVMEQDLDRLYEFDLGLLDQVVGMEETIAALRAGAGSPPSAQVDMQAAELRDRLDGLERALDERERMLKGVE